LPPRSRDPVHFASGTAVAHQAGGRIDNMNGMNGGSRSDDGLLALRRAFSDVAEMAQRAVARLDVHVDAQREAHESRADTRVPVRVPRPEDRSREVARALRYIEANYDQRLSLARLARVAGCCRSTLTRAFRRELGQTVHAYLVQRRLAHAASGVKMGDKIEAVMLGVGFRSKRNFYRQFKAHFGRTPADFRTTRKRG
jgi:AraC-like DNA-binding protein